MVATEAQEEAQYRLRHDERIEGISILEKVVRNNSDEIEETDTRGTQEIGTAEAQGQEDLTWMYLDSDADPEDVDNWEVDMGLKQGYEYPENVRTEMRQQILEGQQLDHKREKPAIKEDEATKASVQLEELMTTV